MANSHSRWQFWIDRGGTFTDIVAQRPDGSVVVHKLLSENPERYEDAPIQGMRELMGLGSDAPLPAENIGSIKMGTTVATNALLERKGDRTLFMTTQGFKDGLRIGYQHRPDIFARHIVLPDMLYEQVVEVPERMSASGKVIKALTPDVLEKVTEALTAAYHKGILSCAIAFIHGYRYPAHEQQIAAIARQIGFTQISVSHQVSPLIKWVSRGDTTVVDAYLSPILRRYVDRIERVIAPSTDHHPQLLFMQSNGGLTPAQCFQGKDSILSGPAGGIVGAVKTTQAAGFNRIITFDMGGTSTDVAHYRGASESAVSSPTYERVFETEVAGVRMRSPMMAIHTVAAGGGSILSFEGSRYQVGPASAGAHPGPACYRNGGPLTITDCNVMVGKIQPQFFPQVFGPGGNQVLDTETVRHQFTELASTIKTATGDTRSGEQVAAGFLSIAIDNMANAIKKISVQKGYDIADYALCCFGAAGGQHVCHLAEALGIKTIFIHPYAGVLSAYGMGLAERRVLKEKSVAGELTNAALSVLAPQMDTLAAEAKAALQAQGCEDIDTISLITQLHVGYSGTDTTLAVDFADLPSIQQQFESRYQQQYGITQPNKFLIVAMLTAEAIGQTHVPAALSNAGQLEQSGESIDTVSMFSADQWQPTPVFQREELTEGVVIQGPAIVLEKTGTNVVEAGWSARLEATGALILSHEISVITTNSRNIGQESEKPDPVRLEIFNNLFQAIAQQMGVTLQNTSSSVNIKERLDFSCAIFDQRGQLVANAPHIPVHLGSMGESVKALINSQIDSQSEPFSPGDTFISNNPYNGGTHLPDITAITPVFIEAADQKADHAPLFFVASRGHHADIGGITPGSMPPNSTHLDQEGILLDNLKLVSKGILQAKELQQHLSAHTYPARNPAQNLADLQAQIAANNKGMQELRRMVTQFGLFTVQSYMQHVQDNAEQAVRRVIQQLYAQQGATPLKCQVPMDCGATIQVTITLNSSESTAIIDFTGTSAQQNNNFNAPLAVCKAAVLYVFRTLVDTPIPLNAGCLNPLNIVVPQDCLLSPRYPAAVVAGNVETSQAVTDALYGALGVLAASQGTMNNFTFGNAHYQYYETICGGSGAGPTFAGTDAVQTHMTNSRLTDPEVLEMRFPVLLEDFVIRNGSGGKGAFTGGNGVIRRLRFDEAMTASLLAGRRRVVPFGLHGGEAGTPGKTTLVRADGQKETLAGTVKVEMAPGDVMVIATPGGGGYGV